MPTPVKLDIIKVIKYLNNMSKGRQKTITDKKSGVRLTPKQKAFADYLLNNPKASATEAVKMTYNLSNPNTSTARSIANENRTKPNIQLYMDSHIDKAKQVIVNLLDSEKEEIRFKSAESILDRTFGKASQKQESTSVSYIQHVSDKRNIYNL